jgi:hypothetical protein
VVLYLLLLVALAAPHLLVLIVQQLEEVLAPLLRVTHKVALEVLAALVQAET